MSSEALTSGVKEWCRREATLKGRDTLGLGARDEVERSEAIWMERTIGTRTSAIELISITLEFINHKVRRWAGLHLKVKKAR